MEAVNGEVFWAQCPSGRKNLCRERKTKRIITGGEQILSNKNRNKSILKVDVIEQRTNMAIFAVSKWRKEGGGKTKT